MGGAIGSAVGSMFGGPVGGAIGGAAGSLLGGAGSSSGSAARTGTAGQQPTQIPQLGAASNENVFGNSPLAALANLAGIPATAAVPGAATGANTSGAAALGDVLASAAQKPDLGSVLAPQQPLAYQQQAPAPTTDQPPTGSANNAGWNYPTGPQDQQQPTDVDAFIKQLINGIPGLLGL